MKVIREKGTVSTCRNHKRKQRCVYVRRAAGVFRSVWKVGSRWSSVDRLFEPRVSLSGCFQGGQNEETFEFRFQEQMQNAIQQRYPF